MRNRNKISQTVILGSLAITATMIAFQAPAFAQDKVTLRIAYSQDFVPLTPELGKAYWASVIDQFQKANPNVTVEAIPVPGSYKDFENKMGLLYRSPDTAPDLAELSNQNIVQWIESGYLADLSEYAAKSDWYKTIPDSVKAEYTLDGKTYGISHGENEMGLLYDKTLFNKAGIAMPWEPKSWKDVLDAARKIKSSSPDAWPLWLSTGTAQGASAASYGPNSLLLGSSDPTIYDAGSQKWVVDSKGIREVIDAYRTASAEGLLAPASQLLNATAIATPPTEIPNHHIGITLAGNWFSLQWVKKVSAPYYPNAKDEVGYAPLPTVNGQAPGVGSALSGWGSSIYANSKNKDIAWKFIELQMTKGNILTAALNGWTPPTPEARQDKDWLALDPFQEGFQKLLPQSVGIPLKAGYPVWAMGFITATEAVVLDPTVSVDDAVQKMNDYVANQLGADQVMVKK
ncbi:extracellular solute-binding protein [Mesorhizobium sp. B2-4-17]|uniref:ABC transporter substrate-binding protein n=1 Tax=Mesorhizobium sp. B2-4-17 TaxID=2589932 RepID=UPI00112A72CD|nr:extracellular solute-binding protein [Mesorhizobium sp. B2-4-17]TPK85482.1 extracellular solute-binding protein [Mesorhizobium sp. B2-4-17]